MAVLAGDVQRRRAVLIRPVDLRAFIQQQPRRVDVALLAGGEQRRLTVLPRPIDLRAFVQQQPRRVDVAVLAGDEQRRRAVLSSARSTSAPLSSNSRAASTWPFSQAIAAASSRALRPVDLRAVVQQQPRRVDVALLAGDEQRRPAVLRRPIDLRAFVQQQPRRVDVALSVLHLACDLEQRAASTCRSSISARSTSAPFSSNSRAASTWPFLHASYRTVVPSFVRPIHISAALET